MDFTDEEKIPNIGATPDMPFNPPEMKEYFRHGIHRGDGKTEWIYPGVRHGGFGEQAQYDPRGSPLDP